MYDSRYTPTLKLDRTISHPLEDVRVAGFTGRDTIYGRNAVILKAEEIPRREKGGEEYTAILEPAYRLMEEQDHALYIYDDEEVLAAPAQAVEDVEPLTFETFVGEVQFQSLRVDGFHSYDREEVEIE
jgi:hypothetical protein